MAARGATSTQWWHLLAPSTLHGYQIQRDPDPRSLDVPAYLRLLDADAAGADWREVARIVLHLDPDDESDRARRAFDSHLSRAKWMTKQGYRLLLRGGASA